MSRDLKQVRKQCTWITGGRAFQAKKQNKTCTKALSQEHVCTYRNSKSANMTGAEQGRKE